MCWEVTIIAPAGIKTLVWIDSLHFQPGDSGTGAHRLKTHTALIMSDSESASAPAEAPVPAACEAIKADLDKCLQGNGEEGCKELMEAFAACVKSAAGAS